MKITYDSRRNIGYIRLRDKTGQVETIRISDELNIDLTPDGIVYGIELLNANEQLSAGLGGVLTIVNEANGQVNEIKLDV